MINAFKHSIRQYPLWLFLVVYGSISPAVLAQRISGLNYPVTNLSIPDNIGYSYPSLPSNWSVPQADLMDTCDLNRKLFKNGRPLNFYSLAIPALGITYGVVALHKSAPQALNFSTKFEIEEDHPHFLTHVDNYLQFSPAVAVIGLNIAGVHGAHSFVDELSIYGISSLILIASVRSIKPLTHEERPDHSGFNSFPSGHTATAFAAAEWLRAEYWHRSPWIGVAGYAVATTTGLLRVYNNRHWVSDVVAGAAIGFLSTRIAYAVDPWVERHVLHADRKKNKLSFDTREEMFY